MANKGKHLWYAIGLLLIMVLCIGMGQPGTGTIKGRIVPADAVLKIKGRCAVDSFIADVPSTGQFIIKGIKPGSYQLELLTRSPYKSIKKSSIVVQANDTTNLGEIVLVDGEAK